MTQNSGSHEVSSGNKALATAFILLLLAYFLGQIVAYISLTRFYGQGLTYLINFMEIGFWGYVRVYLLNFSYYPPFYYAYLLIVNLFFGIDYLPFALASGMLVAGGGLYVYFLVRHLSGKPIALFSFALFLLVPATTLFSKTLIIETPLLLFIPAVFYHLYMSARFTSYKHCMMLGLVTSLGLLTKWTFALYVGPAFLYFFVQAFWGAEDGKFRWLVKRQWSALLLVTGIVCLFAGWWYLFVFDFQTWRATAANDPRYSDYNYIRHLGYCIHLLSINFGKVFGKILAGAMLVLFVFSKKPFRLLAISFGLFWLPYFLFATPVHMEDRYFYPLVPAAALTVAYALAHVRFKVIGAITAAVLMGGLIYNHAIVYYPLEKDMFRDDDPVIHRWGKLYWGKAGTPQILQAVNEHAKTVNQSRQLTIAAHPIWTDYHSNFIYMVYFLGKNKEMREHFRITRFTKFRYKEFSGEIEKFDYLVMNKEVMERCMEGTGQSLIQYLEAYGKQGYVDQTYGTQHESFGLDDVQKDSIRITQAFRPLKTFQFDNAYTVLVMVNRKLDDPVNEKSKTDTPANIGLEKNPEEIQQ